MAGGAAFHAFGGDWRHGVLIGGLLADIGSVGRAAFLRGGTLSYAMKAMAPQVILGGGAAAYGYYKTGTIEGAIQYGTWGVMLGGIGSAMFIKCFVAGTPVYVPAPVNSTTQVLAMANHHGDTPASAEEEADNARVMAGMAAFMVGVAGWTVSQWHAMRERAKEAKRREEEEQAMDAVFEGLAWN